MNLKESVEYQRQGRRHRTNVVIAADDSLEINQVIQIDARNYRVAEVLSREEFLRRHRDNMREPNSASGMADMDGPKVDIEGSREATEPPDDLRYFYALERL